MKRFISTWLCLSSSIILGNFEIKSNEHTDVSIVFAEANTDLTVQRDIYAQSLLASYKNLIGNDLSSLNDKFVSDEAFIEHYNQVFEREVTALNNGECYFLSAIQDGKPVGWITVDSKPSRGQGEFYLREMAVDNDFKRKGIGSALLQAITHPGSPLTDAKTLLVITRKMNIPSIKLFEKLGYVESDYMHPDYSSEKYLSFEKKVN